MTKKSFENPAMNYIVTPEPEQMPQAEEQAAEPERAQHSRTETPRRPKA